MRCEDTDLSRIADLDLVLQRLDGDVELLRELATLYITEYPNQLQGLLDAVSAGDPEKIHRVAHKIKGTAFSFGAEPATEAARKLEETPEFTGGRDATDLAERLSHELSRLHLALEEFLARRV
jgi:HPt (histidine-containing phosphotransfer) domain-containing protein